MSTPSETTERRFLVNVDQYRPDDVLPIDAEFAGQHAVAVSNGAEYAARSRVIFVGMARQIAGILPATINRIEALASRFAAWNAVVVENDSTDGTKDVLRAWAERRPGQVVADCRDLGRDRLSGFEATRVERYAEYRTRCRDLALEAVPFWPPDDPVNGIEDHYVIALDLDAWGGWSDDGVMSSICYLEHIDDAGGMASTSLYQGRVGDRPAWLHYDIWALRVFGWRPRWDAYLPFWLPPPGADPIPVNSAFGALVVYHRHPFFACTPRSIDGDIEHVGLHREMVERGGWRMYLNPASRTVMHWAPQLVEDAGGAAG